MNDFHCNLQRQNTNIRIVSSLLGTVFWLILATGLSDFTSFLTLKSEIWNFFRFFFFFFFLQTATATVHSSDRFQPWAIKCCAFYYLNFWNAKFVRILDSEKYAPWSWMVDLAIPGRTGSQAPSAPGGVFWMNQAIFWPAPFLKFLKKLWEILKSRIVSLERYFG